MKVAAIQHDIVWEQAERTHDLVRPMIAEAAERGAGLIVLSEMFATGFSMNPQRVAEPEGGPSERFLRERAAAHDAVLIASIAQRGADGAYRNNAIVARPDGALQRYAKIHPFSYSGEHRHYAAGSGPLTVPLGDLRVSVFVCYDLRFADEFWTLAPATDLYVVPANWPAARQAHWPTLLSARAIENQAYVVEVNRVGTARGSSREVHYAGGSLVVDPLGAALAEGGRQAAVLTAEVSAERVCTVRREFPFLADRR